jgi:hypothetical protein
MATSGIGIDVAGDLLIGQRTPAEGGSAFLTFGNATVQPPLVIDNTTIRANVTIAGVSASTYSVERYRLISVDVVVPDDGDLSFPNTVDGSYLIGSTVNNTRFQIAPGSHDVSWQITSLAPCQLGIYCHAGSINGLPLGLVAASVVGTGTNNGQVSGRFMFNATSAGTIFSIRNVTGGDLTLPGNAGGTSAVSASMIVRLLAPLLV